MKLFKTLADGAMAWCMMCALAIGQTGSSTAPTTSPAPPGGSASPIPTNGGTGNSATNANNPVAAANPSSTNPSSPATTGIPPSAGSTPLSGAQPGQTGSMESQRLNSLNQAYENQQRATTEQQRQQDLRQGGRDINQLAPVRPLRGTAMPLDALTNGRVNVSVDRNIVIGDLRRQGRPLDDWRVVNHQGRWWYWTPDNSWLYFDNGSWTGFGGTRGQAVDRPSVQFPAGYAAEDWRLVQHNGRWWFWTPNQTWKYFRDGEWNDYRATRPIETESRYGVGYRGEAAATGVQGTAEPSDNPIQAQDEARMNVDSAD